MESRCVALLVEPGDQFGRQARRVKGRRGFEHHAQLPAVLVEGDDAVCGDLVVAEVPSVLLAVGQQVSVQLLDVVLPGLGVGLT